MSIYDFSVKSAAGEDVNLSDYKGKVLLIVNTASKCGFTKQYEGPERMYEDLKGDGLEVFGFPCNQFGGQEPGSDSEIQEFCKLSFGVKFPVFSKVEVNGENAHPLYQYLKAEAPGVFGTKSIKWNFTKFIVDRNGKVVKRFSPKDSPEKIKSEIVKIIKN
ncbi:MAG: glutathione peroxidase [Halobacteriovoraceae bacterium]|nr:glutathione peroxidase [Halobacteriovoraceae bacterium]